MHESYIIKGVPNSVTSFVNNYPLKGEPFTKLQVLVSPMVTQEQLWRIFDIAPGMEYCRIFPDFRAKAVSFNLLIDLYHAILESTNFKANSLFQERLLASVTYSTPQQAAYARDKIHGFEYPPGQHMIVRPDYSENTQRIQQIPPPISMPSFSGLGSNSTNLSKADIELLAENVKQATAFLKAHTNFSGISPANYDPNYCTAKLPPVKKFDNEEDHSG